MKSVGLAVLAGGLLVAATGVMAEAPSSEVLIVGAPGAEVEDRESIALKVSTAGVDFADPVSVAKFRRDVSRQIEEACNPGDRLHADMKPDFECRRQLTASLEPRLHQLARFSDSDAPRRN